MLVISDCIAGLMPVIWPACLSIWNRRCKRGSWFDVWDRAGIADTVIEAFDDVSGPGWIRQTLPAKCYDAVPGSGPETQTCERRYAVVQFPGPLRERRRCNETFDASFGARLNQQGHLWSSSVCRQGGAHRAVSGNMQAPVRSVGGSGGDAKLAA